MANVRRFNEKKNQTDHSLNNCTNKTMLVGNKTNQIGKCKKTNKKNGIITVVTPDVITYRSSIDATHTHAFN